MLRSRAFCLAGAAFAAAGVLTACNGANPPAPGVSAGLTFDATARPPVSPPSEGSVAYQVNAAHTGSVSRGLRLPLKELWSVNLGGSYGGVGYPVVANDIVVVTSGSKLFALNAKNGKTLWTQGSPSGYAWIGPAYDNGMIFASPSQESRSSYVGMYAFDERTGKEIWSESAPGQAFFSSPPTASGGTVYTAAAAVGGTVYAYDETSGALKWTASVENGEDSSPVVTPTGIYVSYACPQTYDFKPSSGKQIWHYSGPCEGGGGSTPVLYDGRLFVGDSDALSGYNGLILRAKAGRIAGGFNSYFPPAFAQSLGYFVASYGYSGEALEARKVSTMRLAWSVTLNSDSYVTPPLVAGNVVYVETAAGTLFGYDAQTGKQTVDMALGNSGYRGLSVGLGYGSKELFVPDGTSLIAIEGR